MRKGKLGSIPEVVFVLLELALLALLLAPKAPKPVEDWLLLEPKPPKPLAPKDMMAEASWRRRIR